MNADEPKRKQQRSRKRRAVAASVNPSETVPIVLRPDPLQIKLTLPSPTIKLGSDESRTTVVHRVTTPSVSPFAADAFDDGFETGEPGGIFDTARPSAVEDEEPHVDVPSEASIAPRSATIRLNAERRSQALENVENAISVLEGFEGNDTESIIATYALVDLERVKSMLSLESDVTAELLNAELRAVRDRLARVKDWFGRLPVDAARGVVVATILRVLESLLFN